jgi:hypothetical protein
VPTTIGLIFDMSGSMTDKVDQERQAVIEFLKTSNPQDLAKLWSRGVRISRTFSTKVVILPALGHVDLQRASVVSEYAAREQSSSLQ